MVTNLARDNAYNMYKLIFVFLITPNLCIEKQKYNDMVYIKRERERNI